MTWSGGSIWSGISGRTFPMSIALMLEENTSGLRNAHMTSSWRVISIMSSPGTTPISRIIGWNC